MSVVVTHCSIEFTVYFGLLKERDLMGQTIGEVSILLAECGRGSRLPMSMSQHRIVCPTLALADQ